MAFCAPAPDTGWAQRRKEMVGTEPRCRQDSVCTATAESLEWGGGQRLGGCLECGHMTEPSESPSAARKGSVAKLWRYKDLVQSQFCHFLWASFPICKSGC